MRQGNLRKIALASFLSAFGSSMYLIAVTWMMYQMTGDAAATGALIGFGFVPGLFLNLFVGILVDRWNRKRLAVWSNVISIGAIVILLVAMELDAVRPWLLIGVHMVIQLFATLYRPSIQAFLAEVFEKGDLPKVFSQTSAAVDVGLLVGASLGGVMLALFGATVSISLVTGMFLVATMCIAWTKSVAADAWQSGGHQSKGKRSVIGDLVSGYRYLNSNPFFYGLFGMMFVGQLVMHSSNGLLVVYVSEYLHETTTVAGFMQATVSVGGVLAGVLTTWYLYRVRRYVASVSLLITAMGLAIMAFAELVPIIFAGVLLVGLGTTWLRVLMQSVQQVATDPAYYGRMASYRMLANQTSVAISSPILGMIADGYGVNYSYAVMMIPVLLSMGFSLYFTNGEKFRSVVGSIVPSEGAKKQAA